MTTATTVQGVPSGRHSAALSFTRVNPLECREEITGLFLDHGRPEFPGFFDRAYPHAVAAGAVAWIGRDGAGRAHAFVTRFPHRFRLGGQEVRGGLLGNLLVSNEYRHFWPALALMRAVVNDTLKSGAIDLLYGDPNDAALAVARTVGFRVVRSLQRFVLPLGDDGRLAAAAMRLWGLAGRLASGWRYVAAHIANADEEGPLLAGDGADAAELRPVRHAGLFRARLVGYPARSDRWFVVHPRGRHAAVAGRALVRGPDAAGRAWVAVLECRPAAPVAAVLAALAARVRALGGTRLELACIAGSRTARAARRAGFLPRPERTPLVTLPFTPLGTAAAASSVEWTMLPVDLDR